MRELTFDPEALPSQENYDQIDYLMQFSVHERINLLLADERRLEWALSYCYIDDKLITNQETGDLMKFLAGLARLIKIAVDWRITGNMCALEPPQLPILELLNPMADWSRAYDLVARLGSLLVLESVKVKPHQAFVKLKAQQKVDQDSLMQTVSMMLGDVVEEQREKASPVSPTLLSLEKGWIGLEILGWDVDSPSLMTYRTTTVYLSDVEGRVFVDGFSLD